MFRKTNPQQQPLLNVSLKGFFLLSLSLFLYASSKAQGDLLITPKRVVFENNKRSEDLNLANIGKDSASYVISFIQLRMKENGSVEKIDQPDSGQLFAEPYLRIFPRTVTLAPNEAQTIKLQVRRNSNMQTGEYRSHLYFRAVPREKPLGEKTENQDSALSVKLTPIYGISIPVIVRVGESDTQVQLEDVALQTDSLPALRMTFNRKGNMSVYGDLTVNHISKQGKVTQVGIAKGLAVYVPNQRRNFSLLLDRNAKVNYHTGKLQVLFTDQSSKPLTLAEKEILLN
jgi:P pilus assembly chaperone PapD